MINQTPLVSIIMPAYNAEKYIHYAIKSVIEQTFENWELIIIDDCSSDSTSSIIEDYVKIDKRIFLFKNVENSGVSFTRNKAISVSKGIWIAFLDSDDIWVNDKLKLQLQLANNFDASFIFSSSSFIDEENNKYRGILKAPSQITYKGLLHHNVISCSSVLIKRELVVNNQMECDHLHEDYLAWLKILKSGYIAYGCKEPLLIYRISKSSKSGNKLKTLKMTFGVYRQLGINRSLSIIFLVSHLYFSFIKYINVFSGVKLREE